MRLVGAALFVYGTMLLVVVCISSLYTDDQFPWWSIPTVVVTFPALTVGALILFNCQGYRLTTPPKSAEEHINELRGKGLIHAQSFSANRAFQVEEFEDEGSHYFIELNDGQTLYLNGQYLYEFEPIDDDPEFNQPRKFPCTEFTILRHKENGDVMDILCVGRVFEPETCLPPFSKGGWKQGIPEDGAIIANTTYEEIKTRRRWTSKG